MPAALLLENSVHIFTNNASFITRQRSKCCKYTPGMVQNLKLDFFVC